MTSIVQEFLKLFNSMIEESKSNKLILEGMISVPESVLRPIIDFYLDTYAQFQAKKIRAAKSFPKKTIQLDLKGTKWQSLSDEPINIIIEFLHPLTNQNPNSVPVYGQPNTYRIKLVLENPRWAMSTIEHEVVHVLQDLMRIKTTENWKKKHGVSTDKDEDLYPKIKFGLPPEKKLVKTKIPLDYYGNYMYKKSDAIRKTPIHEKRPIEHYTDLLESIRDLRMAFEEIILNKDYDNQIIDHAKKMGNKEPESLLKDTPQNRDAFFKQIVGEIWNSGAIAINRNKTYPFVIKIWAHTFKRHMLFFRKISKKMWHHMLSIAYDEFVNKGSNYDMKAIYKQLENLTLKYKEEPSIAESFDDDEPTWEDIIKGEWWINKDGTSDYADQDVGEAGHEMIAIKNLLSEFSDNFREAFEEENISGDNIREFIESDDFEYLEYAYHNNEIPDSIGVKAMGELWNEMKKDSRSAYSKHTGAILVINHNFAAWKIDAASLRAMQNFIWEQMSENKINLKNAEVVVSEQSTGNYNSIPVDNFLQLKGPRQLWMINEMKKKDQHSWRAKLGKNTFVDECRMCLVLKINSDHGTYYRFPDSEEAMQKCPPCNKTNLNSKF